MPPPAVVPWIQPLINATIAGSATALGGVLVLLCMPRPTDATISFTLSLAAGVMVTVSLVDLYLPIARQSLLSCLLATAALLGGAALTALLMRIQVPEPEQLMLVLLGGGVAPPPLPPLAVGGSGGGSSSGASSGGATSPRLPGAGSAGGATCASSEGLEGGGGGGGSGVEAGGGAGARAARAKQQQWRLGLLLFIILTLHNAPEGMAVGVSTVKSRELGLALVVGIFLHNIFEGVVIAVPILAATGNKWLALGITAVSGLSEPLGAGVGVLLLRGVAGRAGAAALEQTLNVILCGVGGVMLQVSRLELLPNACRLGEPKSVMLGFLCGAGLIGLGIVFLPVE